MKTYITYFNDAQIDEYNLQASEDVILFKGNDTSISGDSINYLNTYYCELCTLYWVWKNTDDKLLCFEQYRRPFDHHNIVPRIGEAVTYEKNRMKFSICEQFAICHGKERETYIFQTLIKLFGKESPYVLYWVNADEMYTNTTMIINRDDFDKMCEFVFSVLFELDKIWGLNLNPENYAENAQYFTEDRRYEYQRHFMAYIGERLVSAYIKTNLKTITIPRLDNDGYYKPWRQKVKIE